MLSACTAEAGERIVCDIVSALNGNFLDGLRHIFNSYTDESVSYLFGAPV